MHVIVDCSGSNIQREVLISFFLFFFFFVTVFSKIFGLCKVGKGKLLAFLSYMLLVKIEVLLLVH